MSLPRTIHLRLEHAVVLWVLGLCAPPPALEVVVSPGTAVCQPLPELRAQGAGPGGKLRVDEREAGSPGDAGALLDAVIHRGLPFPSRGGAALGLPSARPTNPRDRHRPWAIRAPPLR